MLHFLGGSWDVHDEYGSSTTLANVPRSAFPAIPMVGEKVLDGGKRGFTTGADCLQHLWIPLSDIGTERSGHACRLEAKIVP